MRTNIQVKVYSSELKHIVKNRSDDLNRGGDWLIDNGKITDEVGLRGENMMI